MKIDVESSENQGLQAKININGKTIQTNENLVTLLQKCLITIMLYSVHNVWITVRLVYG